MSRLEPGTTRTTVSELAAAPTTLASEQLQANSVPILDRSRAILRLPTDLLGETLRIASLQRYEAKFNRLPKGAVVPDAATVKRLQQGLVVKEGKLDPIAFEMLDVVNMASLLIAVNLSFGNQSSVPTVWATPKLAVISSSLDPNFVEFHIAEAAQLPHVLAQLVVLRSPQFVGQAPIAVNAKALVAAESRGTAAEEAIKLLAAAGLEREQAERLLAFQKDDVRWWRISSTWTTGNGQERIELRGLDAGPNGQWLLATIGSPDSSGQMNFTPQGHGDIMKTLRLILPKRWVGTPLNPPII